MKQEKVNCFRSPKFYFWLLIGGLVGGFIGSTIGGWPGIPLGLLLSGLFGVLLAKPDTRLSSIIAGVIAAAMADFLILLFMRKPDIGGAVVAVEMVIGAVALGAVGGIIANFIRESHTMRNVFHSPRFVVGFTIFVIIVMTAVMYQNLDSRGVTAMGTYGDGFLKPGQYFSIYDANISAFNSTTVHRVVLPNAEETRHEAYLPESERQIMVEYLARKSAYSEGFAVKSDTYENNDEKTGKSAGMARDLDLDLDGELAALEAEKKRLIASIDDLNNQISDPSTSASKAKNLQKRVEEYQLRIDEGIPAEEEAKREERLHWILLQDAVAQWTEKTGLSAAQQDRVALLSEWDTNYTQVVAITGTPTDEEREKFGLPEDAKNGTYFMNKVLELKGTDIQHYERINKALKIDPKGTMTYTQKGESASIENQPIQLTDYTSVGEVANAITFPLGTDNAGHDMLMRLVDATGKSLLIGLLAGTVATLLGLLVGLLAGYVGGIVDDILTFIMNIFTVIPGFVLIIIIYNSVSKAQRGILLCGLIIGFTSWVWTARSVRSQVISLRNRDHVNLSKLSGHSLFRIILTDILPYIASYVVMAFILQVSSGILAEAQLSILGLGPNEAKDGATLGLLMNWAKLFGAYTSSNAWWAYFPVIGMIALISFSLNLMNTGLDQVFNPTLRD